MICLTEAEVANWLKGHGIPPNPYEKEAVQPYAGQANLLKRISGLVPFSEELFHRFGQFEKALIVITDWSLYLPVEMALFDAVRKAHGEERPLIEAPGHLLETSDILTSAGLFALTILFGWSAFVYFADGQTFFNWEGDLLDYWMNSKPKADEVVEFCRRFQLPN